MIIFLLCYQYSLEFPITVRGVPVTIAIRSHSIPIHDPFGWSILLCILNECNFICFHSCRPGPKEVDTMSTVHDVIAVGMLTLYALIAYCLLAGESWTPWRSVRVS
ncbi:hypothetical protein BDV28DRAFT_68654 [Aspergillus coremiiformis]|uniref:Uncharacterized protein n=1 Tax=Aspergillus coremiiformis TaxID=138285 RepID=A0A5N6YUF8_9EURO|nr:hypothetical protein BDV28DRAFT_68654 [Aspergillus coremiiformis]